MSDGYDLCDTCDLSDIQVPEDTTRKEVEGDDVEVCPDCGSVLKNYTAEANAEHVTTIDL